MKKIIISLLSVVLLVAFYGCSEDDLSSTSVVTDSVNEENEFDVWLEENFRAPYNIQFKYKYEDIESDLTYDLVPAELSQSIILAKMVKYLWLEPYTEIAGLDFLRNYAPRLFHIIGTVGWNTNGTYTLGTAEGGLKITLYAGNWLSNWFSITYDSEDETSYTVDVDIDNINEYYLHVIHHEFGHILHQTIDYPNGFKLVTSGSYSADWTSISDSEALQMGFISAYASSGYDDDFVETLSYYITLSDENWETLMNTAGDEGAALIEQKVEYVREYMADSWDIDLDELKEILARRYDEIYDIDWVNL